MKGREGKGRDRKGKKGKGRKKKKNKYINKHPMYLPNQKYLLVSLSQKN